MNLKKNWWLIWLFAFGTFGSATAQSANQLLFDKTVDVINCEIARLSLEEEENGAAPNIEEFANQFDCSEKLDNPALIQFLEGKGLTLNVKLNESVNEFKNKFSPELEKDQLVSLLENDLLDVRLEAFANNHVDSYNILKKDLTDYIKEVFKEFDPALVEAPLVEEDPITPSVNQPTPETSQPEKQPGKLGGRPNAERTGSGAGFWLGLLGGLLLGALGFRMMQSYLNRNKNSILQSTTAELNQMKIKKTELEKRIDELLKENEELKTKVNEMSRELELLKEDVKDSYPLENEGIPQNVQEPTDPITPIVHAPVVFYMRTPHKDGFFNDSSKSDAFQPTESVYHFELDPQDPSLAHFKLVEDSDTMSRAIQTYSRYIEPVCESNEPYNSKATRIITLTPGTAILQGGHWKVTQKALIDYE